MSPHSITMYAAAYNNIFVYNDSLRALTKPKIRAKRIVMPRCALTAKVQQMSSKRGCFYSLQSIGSISLSSRK